MSADSPRAVLAETREIYRLFRECSAEEQARFVVRCVWSEERPPTSAEVQRIVEKLRERAEEALSGERKS